MAEPASKSAAVNMQTLPLQYKDQTFNTSFTIKFNVTVLIDEVVTIARELWVPLQSSLRCILLY